MSFFRKTILFSFLFIFPFFTKAQNQDLIVTLKESVLNKMFSAIGDIKGTSTYSFMFIEGNYTWDMINPRIKLHANKASFESDVKVKVGKHDYLIKVDGLVEICYEPTTNLIYVEITKAEFPLNIIFLGNLKHLWDVDLAKYFETPFTFEGPLTMGTEMVFTMPDGTSKTIYCHPLNCGVKIAEKQVTVSAETEFVERKINTLTEKK
ncbi:MAG: hypothetical protein NTX97_14105 [Bacteroidetes bacterium]|nr:hypothetical protein [Bacteroidota bacterium]